MAAYQIVNGIPRPVQTPLEKIDFNKIHEQQKADPYLQLLSLGFSSKQSLILCVTNIREEVYALLRAGANKETILNLAHQHGVSI